MPITTIETFVSDALSGDVRRLDSKQRRVRILAAAIQECSQTGFRDASMSGIAQRARVSTASLYRDFGTREKLLEDSVVFAAPMVAAQFNTPVASTRPRARLIELLIRHGKISGHPHARWMYRAHVSGELSDDVHMSAFGKSARDSMEQFWRGELTALESQNIVKVPQMSEAINFLLGTVQRRTLLAMLLFGNDDVAQPSLDTAATSAVDWFLSQFGTHAYKASRPT